MMEAHTNICPQQYHLMCRSSAACEGDAIDCYTPLGKQLFPEIIDVVVAAGAIIHPYKVSLASHL